MGKHALPNGYAKDVWQNIVKRDDFLTLYWSAQWTFIEIWKSFKLNRVECDCLLTVALLNERGHSSTVNSLAIITNHARHQVKRALMVLCESHFLVSGYWYEAAKPYMEYKLTIKGSMELEAIHKTIIGYLSGEMDFKSSTFEKGRERIKQKRLKSK